MINLDRLVHVIGPEWIDLSIRSSPAMWHFLLRKQQNLQNVRSLVQLLFEESRTNHLKGQCKFFSV